MPAPITTTSASESSLDVELAAERGAALTAFSLARAWLARHQLGGREEAAERALAKRSKIASCSRPLLATMPRSLSRVAER